MNHWIIWLLKNECEAKIDTCIAGRWYSSDIGKGPQIYIIEAKRLIIWQELPHLFILLQILDMSSDIAHVRRWYTEANEERVLKILTCTTVITPPCNENWKQKT